MTPDAFYAGTHRSQYDGSTYANQNCTPASGANGARAATGGRLDRSGGQIRALVKLSEETNPATPGWSLGDLELAMTRLGVPFERRSGAWATVVAAHDAGLFVVLQGDSDRFVDGTCSGRFDGDHAVGLHPGTYADGTWPLADPICLARRPERPAVLRAYGEKLWGATLRFGVFTSPVPKEEDMDDRIIPEGRATVKAGPVFRDAALTLPLSTLAADTPGIQLYGRAAAPAVAAIRIDLAGAGVEDIHVGYVPLARVAVAPIDCSAQTKPLTDRIAGMKAKVAGFAADIAND